MSETCKPCVYCVDEECQAPVPEYVYNSYDTGSSWVLRSVVNYAHECNLFKKRDNNE